MAEEYSATDARRNLSELISRVIYGNERIVINRHGQRVVLISEKEYQKLNNSGR